MFRHGESLPFYCRPATSGPLESVRMTWADAIQYKMFWVQCIGISLAGATLLFLIWYTLETFKLRKAAEKQIALSQDLLQAALDQVEGAARPCITLASKRRDKDEAISELYGVKGISVAKDYEGYLALRNVGNGLALNVFYSFNEPGPDRPKNLKGNSGYLQRLHAEKEFRLPLPVKMTERCDWEIILQYESLGNRKYRTTVILRANVLSNFKFEQISEPHRVISANNSGEQIV